MDQTPPAGRHAGKHRRLPTNRLLVALPPEELLHLAPHLEPIRAARGQVLYCAREPPQHVFFPERSLVSLVLTTRDGTDVEVSVVGQEGIVGASAILGGERTISQAIVQIPGRLWRLPIRTLQARFERSGELRRLLLRHLHTLLVQSFQTALCNRRHSLEQRLCRWLLSTRLRTGRDKLALSQESVAAMLGTRRAGVSEAYRALRRDGLVDCSRGEVTLLDPGRLEERACECYPVIQSELRSLLQRL